MDDSRFMVPVPIPALFYPMDEIGANVDGKGPIIVTERTSNTAILLGNTRTSPRSCRARDAMTCCRIWRRIGRIMRVMMRVSGSMSLGSMVRLRFSMA